jgi:hypothetical protein
LVPIRLRHPHHTVNACISLESSPPVPQLLYPFAHQFSGRASDAMHLHLELRRRIPRRQELEGHCEHDLDLVAPGD